MKFACLGWGSLIWCPKALPVKGQWLRDGPKLPIEFAQESRDKRITLVICRDVPVVTTLWAHLDVESLDEAKEALATREGIANGNIKHSIGSWLSTDVSSDPHASLVAEWSIKRSIDGLVWTALKPRFGRLQRMPRLEEVIEHLGRLGGIERVAAEEYVRLAPRQITTPYRSAIQEKLGWNPTGLI